MFSKSIVTTNDHQHQHHKTASGIKRCGAVKRKSSTPDIDVAAEHLRKLSLEYQKQLDSRSKIMSQDEKNEHQDDQVKQNDDQIKQDDDQSKLRKDSESILVVNQDQDDETSVGPTPNVSESESLDLSGLDEDINLGLEVDLSKYEMKLRTKCGKTIDLKSEIESQSELLERPFSQLTIVTEDEFGNISQTTTLVHDDKSVVTIITGDHDNEVFTSDEKDEDGDQNGDEEGKEQETLMEALADPALDETLRRRSITQCEKANQFKPFCDLESDSDSDQEFKLKKHGNKLPIKILKKQFNQQNTSDDLTDVEQLEVED